MKEPIIPYNPKLKARARELRNNMTQGEIILWQHLKSGRMMGYDFDRQKPIDQFIVDFYCKSLALAIEIDGSVHDSEAAYQYDLERQSRLEGFGIQFLRFRDDDVRQNPNAVCQTIANWIKHNRAPSSTVFDEKSLSPSSTPISASTPQPEANPL